MIVLGLTGSIGMGKSTTAAMFRAEGVPVYDSDAAVHALYAPGGAAVGPVGAAFPQALRDGGIDREALSAAVLGKPEALKQLESIVHPLVREAQAKFLREQLAAKAAVVVLDVPLLFETGADAFMDAVIVVTAPPEVQKRRVLAREGMSEEKFQKVLAQQLADAEKRKRADFVINTAFGMDEARLQVRDVLHAICEPA